jgi:hypothetical protein
MSREIEVRDTLCLSAAECLLRLGQLSRFLVRHGCALQQVARELGVGHKVCALAVAFLNAPDWFKLRALVEDWNLLVIRSRLRATGFAVPVATTR